MKKSSLSENQLIGILKEAESGAPRAELCRKRCISGAISYHWQSKKGDMDVSMIKRMKEPEEENRRLSTFNFRGDYPTN